MTEWTELKTLQEVAAAQARGDEIEYISDAGNLKYEKFKPWDGRGWYATYEFRSRPRKKTKTIVLREALFNLGNGIYKTEWTTAPREQSSVHFVHWLDTPAREVEVEDAA